MSAAAAAPLPVEVRSSEELEQVTHGGAVARVVKHRLLLDARLAAVRKHRPAGPDGASVILVHGFAQNRYTWHGSRRSLSAWLADSGLDVWNLELPGHGDSRREGSPEDFDTYVRDVANVAATVQYTTGRPPFLIGHSLGGAVAYAASTRFPLRGVVGIGALFRFARANRVLRALCALSVAAGRGPLGALNVRTRLAGKLLSRLYGISDIAGYAFPVSGWAPGSIEEDILAERLERGFDWTSANVWFEMARWSATGRFAYEEDFARTDVPLLVVAGDLDHLMLPADARSAYDASGSADRTFLALDDYTTGHHWGHLDLLIGRHAPEHVWRPLRGWLGDR
jgi:polyhydroxyalkanoate synthase